MTFLNLFTKIGMRPHSVKCGRRGNIQNPDRVLIPMSFPTFVDQLHRADFFFPLEDCARLYLKCGGFPFRVDGLIRSLKQNQTYDPLQQISIFDDVFFYEIQRRKLDRSIAIEILSRLAINGCSAVSYEGFSKSLSISKDSVRRYLDALGDAFLVATISSYDTGRGRVAPKKDRKFLWIDPALTYLASYQGQGPEWDEEARAECIVMTALLREWEMKLWEGLSSPRNVFTWKSSTGKEIDFLVVNRAKKLMWPVEVKWQNSITDWDFQSMERAFGTGVLVPPQDSRARQKSRGLPLHEFLQRPFRQQDGR